jgi:aminopeptidase
MRDPRLHKLATGLVNRSIKVQPGEVVLIEAFDIPEEVPVALIRSVREAGGIPIAETKSNRVLRELIWSGDENALTLIGDYEMYRMKQVQGYIGIRGSHNINELSDVDPKASEVYKRYWQTPVLEIRVPNSKWVVLRWPTPSMAQQAHESTEAFEKFYFDVCTLDYSQMERPVAPLKALMEATDEVHIVGPGTDLKFSIKNIPVVPCTGEYNIPDGECFTAPVRDSIEGVIQFNTPTIYDGITFADIRLCFEAGRIVKATAGNTERLNGILDTDAGARYIGEFSLGFNPLINKPILDILFDEKIAGSFHLTPGRSYEEAYNGNDSSVHWDLVCIQTEKYGGGAIYFDGVLVRKDGLFVLPELQPLNPDNLKDTVKS